MAIYLLKEVECAQCISARRRNIDVSLRPFMYALEYGAFYATLRPTRWLRIGIDSFVSLARAPQDRLVTSRFSAPGNLEFSGTPRETPPADRAVDRVSRMNYTVDTIKLIYNLLS